MDSLINEYILRAEPVSSHLLQENYDFGIGGAMIRREMQKLTEAKYLYQPHTSAGRVPTDKGYRFFVNEILESETDEINSQMQILFDFDDGKLNTLRFIQSLIRNLSLASSNFVLGYLAGEKMLWKEGWEELLQEPEFKEGEHIPEFIRLVENLEKSLDNLNLPWGNIEIYIGRENPFASAREFATMIVKCHFLAEGKQGFLAILGPKRMSYKKNIDLLNYALKLLE